MLLFNAKVMYLKKFWEGVRIGKGVLFKGEQFTS